MFRRAVVPTTAAAAVTAPDGEALLNGIPQAKLVNALGRMSDESFAKWIAGVPEPDLGSVVRAITNDKSASQDAAKAVLLKLAPSLGPDLLVLDAPFEDEAAATAPPPPPAQVLLMLDASGSVRQHYRSVVTNLQELEFNVAGGFGARVAFTTPVTNVPRALLPCWLKLDKPTLLRLASNEEAYCSSTDHSRIIDGVRLMSSAQPFMLVIYGDGGFDSVAQFRLDLNKYKYAFASCVYVVFFAMAHTPATSATQIEAVLIEFCRGIPGCGFAMCRTAAAVNDITRSGSKAVRVNGYNTVITPDGPLYVLDVAKRALTDALLRKPAHVASVSKLIVDMAGNAAAVTLFETDPIFAKLYGCITAISRSTADLSTAGIAKGCLAALSRVKSSVSPRSAHEAAIDALIDASKLDVDAYARALDAQIALVRGATDPVNLRVLQSMAPVRDFKALVREACGDGWIYTDELTRGWLRSWYVESPRGPSVAPERLFDCSNPASVELALRLLLGNDVILGPRIVLNLALTGTYDFKLATETERGGLDPTFAALLRSFLQHFRHYDVFGLKLADAAVDPAYEFDIFPDSNLVPQFMRTVLRASRDFPGIVPTQSELLPLFQELLRAKALLQLVHDKHSHTFELPVRVYPKAAAKSSVRVDPHDVVPSKATPKLCGTVRALLNRGGRDFELIVPEMVGVVLQYDLDGIQALTCSGLYTTARIMGLLQKRADESWDTYWARAPATLRSQVVCQCRQMFKRGAVPYTWSGAPPIWLIDFPPDAVAACPLRITEPGAWLALLHADVRYGNGGVMPQLMDDIVDAPLPWKTILGQPTIAASLGLNPAVTDYIVAASGVKLSYTIATELHPRFAAPFDVPDAATRVVLPCATVNHVSRMQDAPVHAAQVEFAVHDATHQALRESLWSALESLTRLRFRLPVIGAADSGEACCWICCTSARVGDVGTWVDLPCCRQALCVGCLSAHAALPVTPGLPLKLYPACPFCNAALGDATLERAGLHARYAFLRANLTARPAPDTRYVYSLCRDCNRAIPTPAVCAVGDAVNALPAQCADCTAPPKDDGTKPCPSCGVLISRIDGCNNVECTLCSEVRAGAGAVCMCILDGAPCAEHVLAVRTSGFGPRRRSFCGRLLWRHVRCCDGCCVNTKWQHACAFCVHPSRDSSAPLQKRARNGNSVLTCDQ